MSRATSINFNVIFPDAKVRYQIHLANWLLVAVVWKQAKRRKKKYDLCEPEKVTFT